MIKHPRFFVNTFNATLLVLGLMGCGSYEDIPHTQSQGYPVKDDLSDIDQDPIVTIEDARQLGVETEDVSYIVAFKDERPLQSAPFASFFSEVSYYFSGLISQGPGSDPRVKDFRVISGIDAAIPGRSLIPPTSLERPSHVIPLFWGQESLAIAQTVLTRVSFYGEAEAEEVLKEWLVAGKIHFAEPNSVSDPASLFGEYIDAYGGSGDSGLFSNLWWLKEIKLLEAYQYLDSQGMGSDSLNNPPVIAVLDSGLDYLHPSMEGRVWKNERNVGRSSCVGDVYGCNTTVTKKGSLGTGDVHPYKTSKPGQQCPPDADLGTCSHGTHVAGIIAANPNTNSGFAGVCPVCLIMVLRVVSEKTGKIPDEALLNAYKYVSLFKKNNENVVRIINSSFGKFQRSRAVGMMIRLLKESGTGVLVVAAAGNEDTSKRSYPAAFSDVVAVSAIESNIKKAAYSNFGPWVDIASPGGPITSLGPGGVTFLSPGTSMASPFVAGIAGLVLAMNPAINAVDLKDILVNSADGERLYSAETASGYNLAYFPKLKGLSQRQPLLGGGLLDAENAIKGSKGSAKLAKSSDRVNSGCGVIAMDRSGTPVVGWSFWAIFFMPLFFVFRGTIKKYTKNLS